MRDPAYWVYRPGSDRGAYAKHKTAHHGHDRLILIGPRAQEIIRPYLGTKLDAYCFSPAAAESQRNALRRANRKTPLTPTQAKRKPAKHPKRPKGDHYEETSYRNAVYRACDKAHPLPEHLSRRPESGRLESRAAWWERLTDSEKDEVRAWRKAHRWHPNRLRHTRATELRPYGLDVVKTVLGHTKVETSQVYAEKDLEAARRVMGRLGKHAPAQRRTR
jgi:site-specific recombinase XerD